MKKVHLLLRWVPFHFYLFRLFVFGCLTKWYDAAKSDHNPMWARSLKLWDVVTFTSHPAASWAPATYQFITHTPSVNIQRETDELGIYLDRCTLYSGLAKWSKNKCLSVFTCSFNFNEFNLDEAWSVYMSRHFKMKCIPYFRMPYQEHLTGLPIYCGTDGYVSHLNSDVPRLHYK